MILKSGYYGQTQRSASLELCIDYAKKKISFDVVTTDLSDFSIGGNSGRYHIDSFANALQAYDLAERWAKGELSRDACEELYASGLDEFSERFEKVMDILEELPTKPYGKFWYDGENILCRTEDQAEAVAYFIDAIIGDSCTHTGYYDPKEDKISNEVDDHTGYYYVDFD